MTDSRIIFIISDYSQMQSGRQGALPPNNHMKQLFSAINKYDNMPNAYDTMPQFNSNMPVIFDNDFNDGMSYVNPFNYQQNQQNQNPIEQLFEMMGYAQNNYRTRSPQQQPQQQNPIDQLGELLKESFAERKQTKLLAFDKEKLSNVNEENIQDYIPKENQLRILRDNKSSVIDIDDGTKETLEKNKIERGFWNKAGHVAYGGLENIAGAVNAGLGYIIGSKSLVKWGDATIDDSVKNMTLDLPDSSYKYTYENANGTKGTANGLTPEIAKENCEEKLIARKKSSDEISVWNLK